MAWAQPVGRSLEEITKDRKELNKKLLETRKEILKIKFSKNFKLNEEDKKSYDSWNKDIKENKKDSILDIKPYKNEKDYVIRKMKDQIFWYKHALIALICEEKGHVESVISLAGHGTYVECKRCGKGYKRPMSIEESKSWTKMMNTHITI